MRDTRIGIIGVGGFGLFSLEEFRQMPGVRVTGIAGTHPEKYARLAEQYALPFHTTDWRALVRHPEVDIVYLATPPSLHAEQALAAAEAGKHIFCEKPLALTLAEADAMLTAAARHHVRLGINFVMRYNALYALLRRITAEGLLGAPQRVLFENAAGDLPAGHWFWDVRQSGGIPVEHGVHFFDVFASILGDGAVRWATCTQRAGGVEDKWAMVLQYGDRCYGTFCHAFDKPSLIERTWSLVDFERGCVRLEGWIPERLTLDGVAEEAGRERLAALLPGARVTPLDGAPLSANGTRITPVCRLQAEVMPANKDTLYRQAVRDALADFIAWTQDPGHQPRVTGYDAREALRVALTVTALARAGR